jgi:hypothetical protein
LYLDTYRRGLEASTRSNVEFKEGYEWASMSKKFGHKLGGSFAPLLTHTRKSAAWPMLSVGARALFMELQSRYYQDREGYVFLSSRDGAKQLRTRPNNIGIWFDELTHYGFLVLLRGPHLGVEGEGQSAHYRLTDRWFHGHAPTRDFDRWSGEVFHPKKRLYSDNEKARLNSLKKQNPVTRPVTPRNTGVRIRTGGKSPQHGSQRNTGARISEVPRCNTVDNVSSIATGSCSLEAWLRYAVQPMTLRMLDMALNSSNQQAA